MFGQTFYHEMIKKYVILFGTLFNDLWINRKDNNGKVIQSIKIPIAYGPRDKFLSRITGGITGYTGAQSDEDPMTRPVAIVLPRLGFEIVGMNYAPERKLSTINRFIVKDVTSDDTSRKYTYNPVPYDINFSLSVFCKNTEDGTAIVEQILPYFTPEWNTTVKLINDPDIVLDVPLVLTDVSQDDVYEGDYDSSRSLIWTLNFVMKAQFFGPIKNSGIINVANTELYDSSLYNDIDSSLVNAIASVDVSPGLTANGEPTSNSALSISANNISSEDNYGFIVDIQDPKDIE